MLLITGCQSSEKTNKTVVRKPAKLKNADANFEKNFNLTKTYPSSNFTVSSSFSIDRNDYSFHVTQKKRILPDYSLDEILKDPVLKKYAWRYSKEGWDTKVEKEVQNENVPILQQNGRFVLRPFKSYEEYFESYGSLSSYYKPAFSSGKDLKNKTAAFLNQFFKKQSRLVSLDEGTIIWYNDHLFKCSSGDTRAITIYWDIMNDNILVGKPVKVEINLQTGIITRFSFAEKLLLKDSIPEKNHIKIKKEQAIDIAYKGLVDSSRFRKRKPERTYHPMQLKKIYKYIDSLAQHMDDNKAALSKNMKKLYPKAKVHCSLRKFYKGESDFLHYEYESYLSDQELKEYEDHDTMTLKKDLLLWEITFEDPEHTEWNRSCTLVYVDPMTGKLLFYKENYSRSNDSPIFFENTEMIEGESYVNGRKAGQVSSDAIQKKVQILYDGITRPPKNTIYNIY